MMNANVQLSKKDLPQACRGGKKGDFEEKSFDLICLKLQNYNYSLLSVVLFFSHLHKNATLIQKIWRGFTARVLFRQRVKVSCGDM